MKKTEWLVGLVTMAVWIGSVFVGLGTVHAEDTLRYSCSAQVFEAFETDRLEAFTKRTQVKVDLMVSSSPVAVEQLANGDSDIASTAQRITPDAKAKGLEETAFCKDPIAIIAHPAITVDDLTDQQLKGIFSGKITNWKDVGGPDKRIFVILPSEKTANHRNFSHKVMAGGEMKYDIMTAQSTLVIEATRHFDGAISFLAQGATRSRMPGVKLVKINGRAAMDEGYPYYQVFSFVTKGKPAGNAKKFIDFATSAEGVQIMSKRGMVPFTKLEE
jgi:phosphate transport system substrate-binding protein